MVEYVKKNVPLISKQLMSTDDLEAFISRADYSIIGELISLWSEKALQSTVYTRYGDTLSTKMITSFSREY